MHLEDNIIRKLKMYLFEPLTNADEYSTIRVRGIRLHLQ